MFNYKRLTELTEEIKNEQKEIDDLKNLIRRFLATAPRPEARYPPLPMFDLQINFENYITRLEFEAKEKATKEKIKKVVLETLKEEGLGSQAYNSHKKRLDNIE
jgi:hypothetical protein